jgi:hypothetical protein
MDNIPKNPKLEKLFTKDDGWQVVHMEDGDVVKQYQDAWEASIAGPRRSAIMRADAVALSSTGRLPFEPRDYQLRALEEFQSRSRIVRKGSAVGISEHPRIQIVGMDFAELEKRILMHKQLTMETMKESIAVKAVEEPGYWKQEYVGPTGRHNKAKHRLHKKLAKQSKKRNRK